MFDELININIEYCMSTLEWIAYPSHTFGYRCIQDTKAECIV